MRCPFLDPEFTLPIDVPCPVCHATGHPEDFLEGAGFAICMEANDDDNADMEEADHAR